MVRNKKFLTIFIISLFLLASISNWIIPSPFIAVAHTQSFTPKKDAYVDSGEAGTNFGSFTAIDVRSDDGGDGGNHRGIIEFDLSTLPPNIEILNATLSVYVTVANRDPIIDIYRVKEAWTESVVTWTNQPDVYTTGEYTIATWTPTLFTNLWENVTVTSLIDQSGGVNATQGFKLKVRTEGESLKHNRQFYSKEWGSLIPTLEVTWQYTYPTNIEASIIDPVGIGLTDYDAPLNDTGLVLLLHMDDDFNTRNIVDDSGNNNDGLLTDDGDEWVSRPLSKCLMFDGVDDYINVTDDSTLNLNNTFTIEAWFKTEMTATGTIIMKYNNTLGQSNYRIWITGGYLKLNIYDGTNDLYVTSPSSKYNDDVWHLVVGQWERGDAAYLYVDNVLVNSTADIITDPVINNWTLTIGIDNDFSSNPFEGFLDEIRIYNRILNVTELTYSWNHGEAHFDNYVYVHEKYYTFQGVYAPYYAGEEEVTDLDTVAISFTDGWHWMNISYNIADDEWSLLGDSSDYLNLQRGTSSYTEGNITVTFPIYFKSTILDVLDVEIYLWCNNTDGVETNWELKAVDYFHIYNIGGQAEMIYSGNAGRTIGGDTYEIYAYNNSWVQANITYRKLQHVHLYVRVEGNKVQFDEWEGDPRSLTFGMYIAPEEDAEWINGWKVIIEPADKGAFIDEQYFGNDAYYITWNVTWYERDSVTGGWNDIKMDTIASFPVWNGTTRLYTAFWVDFWFNNVNGSSVIGGRVNAEFYGIREEPGFFSLAWEAYLGNATQSMFFRDLKKSNGDVISAKQVELMKFYARIEQGDNAYRDYNFELKDYDILDFVRAEGEMTGVATPIFVATKMPEIGSFGFLAALGGVFSSVGRTIVNAITYGALRAWPILVNFLDTAFGLVGWHNGFSAIIAWISPLITWMTTAITYMTTLLTSTFLIMTSYLGYAIRRFTEIGTGFVVIYTNLNWIWSQAAVGWFDLMTVITPLLPLFPLVFFIWMLDARDINGVMVKVGMVWGLLRSVVGFFIQIAQYAIQLVTSIIEAVPVAE